MIDLSFTFHNPWPTGILFFNKSQTDTGSEWMDFFDQVWYNISTGSNFIFGCCDSRHPKTWDIICSLSYWWNRSGKLSNVFVLWRKWNGLFLSSASLWNRLIITKLHEIAWWEQLFSDYKGSARCVLSRLYVYNPFIIFIKHLFFGHIQCWKVSWITSIYLYGI